MGTNSMVGDHSMPAMYFKKVSVRFCPASLRDIRAVLWLIFVFMRLGVC